MVVDRNGKLSHSGEGNLSWSESPSSVVIQPPYALARLSRFIEVCPPSPNQCSMRNSFSCNTNVLSFIIPVVGLFFSAL